MSGAALKDCTNDFAIDDDEEEPRQQRGNGSDSAAKAASTKSGPTSTVAEGIVLDAHRLAQRQKQIDFGKNTLGYECYIKMVPRDQRRRRKGGFSWIDPCTPEIDAPVSKRCFDGLVRVWRKALHKYDEIAAGTATAEGDAVNPPAGETKTECFQLDKGSPALAFPVPQPVASPASRASGAAERNEAAPQKSTGNKRYFKEAFKKGSGAALPTSTEPSPKKLSKASPRTGRHRDVNNILDCILGGESNASRDSAVSLGDGNGYLLADAGVSNDASFCGKLGRLDVQL